MEPRALTGQGSYLTYAKYSRPDMGSSAGSAVTT